VTRIDIRTATASDASLLAELGARTFLHAFGADNTPSDMRAYLASAFGPEIQARELSDPSTAFLIAEVDRVPAGYARVRRGAAPGCIPGQSPLETVRFYADAPWIGKGVGAALMTACLGEAVRGGCDAVWLDVWERNPRAIAFYVKWGFSVVGDAEFLLGDDVQHDLLMARSAL
jgi:diamine N-acetyltransferase